MVFHQGRLNQARAHGDNFLTGVRAFDPFTAGGERARAEVRATAEELQAEGRTGSARALRFIGPPTTRGQAGVDLALSAVPFVGRPAAAGVRLVARPAAAAAPRAGTRLAVRGSGRAAGTQASRQAPSVASGAARAPAGRTGGRAGTRSGRGTSRPVQAASTRPGPLARAGAFARRRPVLTAAGVGGGAFLLGSALTSNESSPSGAGEDGGGGGSGSGGSGGGGGGGPAFVTDPFFGNITAGIGSFFDRLGAGIADALVALGVPIGEGTGKAIAIGGTAILIAVAVTKLAPALRKGAKKAPKKMSGGKGKPKASGGGGRYKAVKGNPAVLLDKSTGKFVSKAKVAKA